jgi:hypothetical protein
MTFLSAWFVTGFALGALAGTLVTDLTREEVIQSEKFKHTFRFWQWSRQQSLVFTTLLWVFLLAVTIILDDGFWKNLLGGTIVGAVAAPWIWLHFVRNFGAHQGPDQAGRDKLITARAHQIWLEQSQPVDRASEHYAAAEKEFEEIEQRMVETSAKSAEQELARYRLVSILLGAAFLITMLQPVLHDWLGRTQQFQAFGVSLTLISQRPDQGRGTPVVSYASGAGANVGGDRLSDAMTDAYRIGAASLDEPIAIPDLIGPDLQKFGNLSVIDRDRVFIAWLTYELPEVGSRMQIQNSDKLTLGGYIKQAEDLVQGKYHPARIVDASLDTAFAAGSSIVSNCLKDYADTVHDPQLFAVEVGRFLRSLVQEVQSGPSSAQIGSPLDYPAYLGSSSELPKDGVGCDFDTIRQLRVTDVPYRIDTEARFKVSPYPSLIAANYLAAIGAVDTGVLLIENWIKDFNQGHRHFAPEYEPQLGWYLLRAKLSAVNLPYQFGGLTVPHRQLVSWQSDESAQFGRLLRVEGADGWKRLCDKILPSTMHNNIGRWLAFIYATDRFYLFETLMPEDFDPHNPAVQKSLTDLLREAEAIRDNHACIESVPSYSNAQEQYTSYFNMYTAYLRLFLLADEHNAAQRRSLTEAIGHELGAADHFGRSRNTRSLIASSDIWERHRVRLKLLEAQLENEAQRDSQP